MEVRGETGDRWRACTWLYSTLQTIVRPSSCVSLQKAPTASLALRGEATMLYAMPCASATPIVARKLEK